MVFDSIQALEIDVKKATKGVARVSLAKALRRSNDSLLSELCRGLKRTGRSIVLLVDEIHFSYKDENTIMQDAMLVRDTIEAISNLNERFIRDSVNCTIYASFRSEFFDHAVIASAEVNNTIASYGQALSWATFIAAEDHPIFAVAAKRVELSAQTPCTPSDFLKSYLASVSAHDFVECTWSKPRDIIRFFSKAKELYPNVASMTRGQFMSVFRAYCEDSWREIKTAVSAFLSDDGILELEFVLRNLSSAKYRRLISWGDFLQALTNIPSKKMTEKHLAEMLYKVGVYQTVKRDQEQVILQSFHRGNRYPDENGKIQLHKAVARAFQ